MYGRYLLGVFVLLGSATASARDPTLSGDDLRWLNRITYGVTTQTVRDFDALGRRRFLAQQLDPKDASIAPAVRTQIDALEISRSDAFQVLSQLNADNQRLNALPEGDEKTNARKALNDHGNLLAYEARKRDLLRALYSPGQLREQLVWFWLNHFSVFEYKANVRWLLADYEERAIRPHALGKFRDLVLATLEHPAMLQYLDNAQNAAGHVNENYARELLELHTLGVTAGYTQNDVQELARILTGAGINATTNTPNLKPEWRPLYRHEGAFEFNPARHDFGTKELLGQQIAPGGLDEIERTIDLIVSQPACAQFISRKLATYFVSDTPSDALIREMSAVFRRSRGDITAVIKVMLDSREFTKSLGQRFKDPMHFVISSLRLAYQDKTIVNLHPVVNWLNALGESTYGHTSPEGYPMQEGAWSSSGQLSKRFEIAKSIASGNAGLFEPEDGSEIKTTGFPFLSSRLYFVQIESLLAAPTRQALEQASSQQEWNTFLLTSPDLNYY